MICPDKGDAVVPNAPLHKLYGNSYVVAWNTTIDSKTSDPEVIAALRNPSQTALVTEAVMYTDMLVFDSSNISQNPLQAGWHGKHLSYDVLSLDLHAEFKYLRVLHSHVKLVSGFQFRLIGYPYIVDYFRTH